MVLIFNTQSTQGFTLSPHRSYRDIIVLLFFFFNDPATTEIYPLPLHDALPISSPASFAPCTAVPSRSIHTFPIAALDSIGQARRTCTHATACGEAGCSAPARALALARTSTIVPDAEASAMA